ncbi:hypothetical protein AAF712_002911 [Marasmius tenuissimus]|uniref:F-box domain-containing protein n=1 Tax=Marasmius tenuissimus TaxID=585030 RepID=A0ABR3AAK6_9AGAR
MAIWISENLRKIMIPDSHFTSVLHTNYVPSSKELKELQQLVLEPQEKIRKLDEEIERLQAQRDELQQFVDSHRALAAPFRRLPADIWGEIFVHCLPRNQLNVAICTVEEAPLLLTTICRAWREVALTTPRLWNSVHIFGTEPPTPLQNDYSHKARQAQVLQGIKMWLDRSGSLPLTLSICVADNTPPMSPSLSDQLSENVSTHLLRLMDLLTEYSFRWRTLSLDRAVRSLYQRSFNQLAADDVPLLETIYTEDLSLFRDLHLFHQNPWNPPWNNPPQMAGTPSPTPMADFMPKVSSLRSLHLQRGSIPTLGIPLGWSRLTELSFDFRPMDINNPSSSPRILLQTLARTCLSLNVLTFRAYLPDPFGDAGESLIDPVEWSSLRELNISLNGLFGNHINPGGEPHTGPYLFLPFLKDIYGSIITPQLLRLFIQLGHRRWGEPISDDILPFRKLIEGSPRLTSLRFSGYHILKPEALADCLQSSTSLTTLVMHPEYSPVSRRGTTGSRMDLEVIPPAPDWVPRFLLSLNTLASCPQLQVFDIGRCGDFENLSSILDFVQSESRTSTLKHLKADGGEVWGERALAMTSHASLIETLRTVHGISVDLKSKEIDPPMEYWNRDPHFGLPNHTYDFVPYP